MKTFNVGNFFQSAGGFLPVPFVEIRERGTDIPVPYYQGVSRLYNLSVAHYGDPTYGQLILLANPEWVDEFDIPDGSMLRIPYPLEAALGDVVQAQTEWQQNLTR